MPRTLLGVGNTTVNKIKMVSLSKENTGSTPTPGLVCWGKKLYWNFSDQSEA